MPRWHNVLKSLRKFSKRGAQISQLRSDFLRNRLGNRSYRPMKLRIYALISILSETITSISREVDIYIDQVTGRIERLQNSKWTYAELRKDERPALLRRTKGKLNEKNEDHFPPDGCSQNKNDPALNKLSLSSDLEEESSRHRKKRKEVKHGRGWPAQKKPGPL